MFDKSKLKAVLDEYKKQFVDNIWPEEKYKWEAVKHFQETWDIDADDFAGMLSEALVKTGKLLKLGTYFPYGMITRYSKMAPEEVRTLFKELFDERKDVWERISEFKERVEFIHKKYDGRDDAQSFQDEHAISVYLWLRYPAKYYVYKFTDAKSIAKALESNYTFKVGKYENNIRNFLAFYNEICVELHEDEELKRLLNSQITNTCYPDPELRTLTSTMSYFVSEYWNKKPGTDEWWPKDYTPGLSVDDWEVLLNDSKVFNKSSLEIMKRILDYGGEASCTQLANKYGGTKNFYNAGSSSLAKRVVKKTGCRVMPRDEGGSRWWSVLYLGKNVKKGEDGSFIWRLRDELAEALKCVDLSEVDLYAKPEPAGESSEQNYWFLNANPEKWSMSSLPVGGVQEYTLYGENGNKRKIFQNFLDAKVGDIVIGYESTPVKQIVAIFRVSSPQDGEKISFEKIEGLSSPIDYSTLKASPELENMEYFSIFQGTFFKLTEEEYSFISDLIRKENPISPNNVKKKYTKTDFLNEVYMTENDYDRLAAVLKKKKNIILQGAPGVGKTFAAKRLAYSLTGEVDKERIEFV